MLDLAMRHQANDIIIAVLAVITALCLSACGGQKATETAPIVDSMDVPVDTMAQDSIDSLAANQPIPKAADEYFNDFIYSFTSNRKYQLTRVRFPLPVQRGSQTTFIQRAQWHFTRLHFKEAVYTVFFDNKRSLDLEKSKTLKQVSIQWFHMKRGETESYLFHRGDDGQWRLEQIKYSSIDDYADAAFIKFYQRFASDEAFQRKHLAGEDRHHRPQPVAFLPPRATPRRLYQYRLRSKPQVRRPAHRRPRREQQRISLSALLPAY